ncbi:MAG: alpha/beta hydrolase, partial [Catalinimonas sp.]
KYLGEGGAGLLGALHRAVVFSVPCHLAAGARNLNRWENQVYHTRFLNSLRRKIARKADRMPVTSAETAALFEAQHVAQVRTLEEFDDKFTAPLHGFAGGSDYYARCSALGYLRHIRVPTLIVNAKNDPLLPLECYPTEEVKNHPHVFLEIPETGGHCGFSAPDPAGIYWSEHRALTFLERALPDVPPVRRLRAPAGY